MSVIINEFEIVPAPAPEVPQQEPTAEPTAAMPLNPADVERIQQRHQQRLNRIHAT